MRARRRLPLPPFFEESNAARWSYAPDQTRVIATATGWRSQFDLAPAANDARKVHLLLIDVQKDFCFPEGSLFVAGRNGKGAVEDSGRIARFIYQNLEALSRITTTMDTHLAYQIFFPSFWVDRDGMPLQAHREITADQVDSGEVRPHRAVAHWLCDGDEDWLLREVRHYCRELERAGKYRLYLWPPHCLLGSEGHALVGVVHEARLFHSVARGAQSWVEIKGDHPLTENYSVLRPEVLTHHDGTPLAAPNMRLLETLLTADALIIAGQAASHCVKSTIDDLLAENLARDPALARRVFILTDCMSSVTVPDGKGGFLADFTPQATAAFLRYADAGMHLVKSTDPIDGWLDGTLQGSKSLPDASGRTRGTVGRK